jgi:hypothetical protein
MERRLGGGLGWGMEEGSKSQQAADVRAARKFPDLDMAVSTFEGKFFRACILYHTITALWVYRYLLPVQ